MKKLTLLFMVLIHLAKAQLPANQDESNVKPYILPDLLLAENGRKIKTIADWEANKPQLLAQFAKNIYGITPKLNLKKHFAVTQINENAILGKAIQKQISIVFDEYPNLSPIRILLYIPKNKVKPPVFLGLNFDGNHALTADPTIEINPNWMIHYDKNGEKNKADEKSRGIAISTEWPFEKIIDAGFAVATAYYGDIEPDFDGSWKTSLRGAVGNNSENSWGAIGAWAAGLGFMQDYLITDNQVDANKNILIGHSRLGKTALWAAAQNNRFKAVISNESGEGGAALFKRNYGETIEIINKNFPHWFSGNFKNFNNKSDSLPVDQHQLMALIAPRPIYVASAEGDQWSDPTGEFLSLKYANPIYKLYGKKGFKENTRPPVNQPIGQYNRYHYRTGNHDVTNYDWEQYLKWAKGLFQK